MSDSTLLEIISKELDRSKSYLINKALKEFLDRSRVEEEPWEGVIKAIESPKV